MKKRILIVDSEEQNFELLAGHIAAALPSVVIDYLKDGNLALTLLESGLCYCLLVTDLKLANADGLEIVQRGIALYENLPVFIGTDFSILDDLKADLAEYPCVRFYQRPDESIQILQDVLSTLQSIPDDVVKTIAFPTLLEMIRLDRKTCLLEFVSDDLSGYLCFAEGELFHASMADKTGESAFGQMISRSATELRIFEGKHNAERNVHTSLNAMLLKCCKDADESATEVAAS